MSGAWAPAWQLAAAQATPGDVPTPWAEEPPGLRVAWVLAALLGLLALAALALRFGRGLPGRGLLGRLGGGGGADGPLRVLGRLRVQPGCELLLVEVDWADGGGQLLLQVGQGGGRCLARRGGRRGRDRHPGAGSGAGRGSPGGSGRGDSGQGPEIACGGRL